ncbi:MAG TPA: DUF937 domain-containing protein [Membranihabitans sp.]|nr:DUF937 domain-containing protein [Membranihabitans sp.]
MKQNLLESFDLEIKPWMAGIVQRMNLASEPTMIKSLSILHASFIGGLIQKTKKENGADSIKSLLEVGRHDGEIINQLPEISQNEAKLSDLRINGNTLLSFVFDQGLNTSFDKIRNFLSQKYQIDGDELVEVSQLVVPFSMDLLGKIVKENQLDPDQIADLLQQHESLLVEKYSGLAQVMGLVKPTSTLSSRKDNGNTSITSSPSSSEVQLSSKERIDTEDYHKERENFFRALWPWVTLLLISGLLLYILKNFWEEEPESVTETVAVIVEEDSLTSLEDSLILSEDSSEIAEVDNTISAPPEAPEESSHTTPLDSVLNYLRTHQSIKDTLKFENSIISFQDSTSTLTISANNELTGLIAIMRANPSVNVGINMIYDSTFFKNHAPIIQERISNLSNYFNAFGLDNSRYGIQTRITDLDDGKVDQSAPENNSPPHDFKIEISFYSKTEE